MARGEQGVSEPKLTWEERIDQIRADLKWMAIEAIKDESTGLAQSLLHADLALSSTLCDMHQVGAADWEFNRPPRSGMSDEEVEREGDQV